ncbi:hypothetical protein [Psychroflexus sp. MES1-P1E]|uniref:hypothetical protein n=1 Tax=Psychroflexus sp. MES1-P1E TaxID=2058320 RepID=UPI0015E0BAEE|nr:hypothetical protein [Psychroflexus sp. MES1-P1E]
MNTLQTKPSRLFIGIDIHRRLWKIHCATNLSGLKTFSMQPQPKLLKDYADKHYSGRDK